MQFTGFELTGAVNQGVWVERSDRIVLDHVTVRANPGAGVQIKSGTGTTVTFGDLSANGIYASAGSSGWRLHDNRLTGNAGANIKAAGTGEITGNRSTDGRWGIVLSDNPAPVAVIQNVIGGAAQHLVFLTTGTTAARALITENAICGLTRPTPRSARRCGPAPWPPRPRGPWAVRS